MAFEQLVAEAAAKKEKKKGKDKKATTGDKYSSAASHMHSADAAADAPNVPRER